VAQSRRQFIQLGGVAAAAAGATQLADAGPAAARTAARWQARTVAEMPEPDMEALLLHRAAFGPRPGDMAHIRDIGARAWIEEQLNYEAIDNSAVEEALLNALPTLSMTARELLDYQGNDNGRPARELIIATIYRMVYSPRMLYEVMVEFWNDHFNIAIPTGLARYFKPLDDRDVMRTHALGNFKDLLTASAQSPAMLNYLDNDLSTARRPNENYGREIMELHTLGAAVDGYPYTENDVYEVARCFTGWTWTRADASPQRGNFEYNDRAHDQSAKNVLGEYIPAGLKQQDGHMVIDRLVNHPATAQYLATKLVRRFVTDDPAGETPELVTRVADTFTRTQGDIKETVYAVLNSREFGQSFATYGGRLSRPVDLVARQLRVTGLPRERFALQGGQANNLYRRIQSALQAMGQVPWYWSTPDGYPDVKEAWASSANMLTRWNLGLALCGAASGNNAGIGGQLVDNWTPTMGEGVKSDFGTAGEAADWWIDRLLSRPMLEEDRSAVIDFMTNGGGADTPFGNVTDITLRSTIALIVDSPYFQWR
jgi:uncharacterized protein (DUF1800 family)